MVSEQNEDAQAEVTKAAEQPVGPLGAAAPVDAAPIPAHPTAELVQWIAANAPQAFGWAMRRDNRAMEAVLRLPGFYEEVVASLEPQLHATLTAHRAAFGLPPEE